MQDGVMWIISKNDILTFSGDKLIHRNQISSDPMRCGIVWHHIDYSSWFLVFASGQRP